MELKYLGHSCFVITAKDGTRIVLDPYTGVGYEMPAIIADYVLCSHGHFDHAFVRGVSGDPTVVTMTGERTLGGIRIEGYASFHDEAGGEKRGENTVYVLECDGVRICHLGDIGQPCGREFVNRLGRVDVLLVPVGGTYTVDAQGAMEYVREIAAPIVVPMHYAAEGGTIDIAPADEFLRLAEEENFKTEIVKVVSACGRIASDKKMICYMERYNGTRA